MRISDWSSDVCSSDLESRRGEQRSISFSKSRALSSSASSRSASIASVSASALALVLKSCTSLSAPWTDGRNASVTKKRLMNNRSRSEEHTSELQSLMRISYAVFCLKKKQNDLSEEEATLDTTTQQPRPHKTTANM